MQKIIVKITSLTPNISHSSKKKILPKLARPSIFLTIPKQPSGEGNNVNHCNLSHGSMPPKEVQLTTRNLNKLPELKNYPRNNSMLQTKPNLD